MSTGQILIADDESGIRDFLKEALMLSGHEVCTAVDGDEAFEIAQKRSFDVLITDLKMPGLDGMELLTKLGPLQPELEIIMLTAHGTVNTAVEAMKLGAFDYIQKPIQSLAELRLTVQRALERRHLRTEADRSERSAPPRSSLTWGAPAMLPILDAIDKVAATHATVLLTGQSGTGKEVTARYIHQHSPRADGPFMAINCATLAGDLLSSELFGHEKGAFTGAHERRRGRLELAQGGTFFLDEVGELQLEVQAKLLRVIEERTYERVGGAQRLRADVRWVAATNRDLVSRIEEGQFREDLYHRLSVFPIDLPPLRERPEDIVPLAVLLLDRVAADLGRPGLSLTDKAQEVLQNGAWPGNVRELRNALERAAILVGTDKTIGPEHLQSSTRRAPTESTPKVRALADVERDAIIAALDGENGNRKRAAERLQIGLRTLYDKLKRYDL